MNCQNLFSRKSKKNITNLSAAEFAQREAKVIIRHTKMNIQNTTISLKES